MQKLLTTRKTKHCGSCGKLHSKSTYDCDKCYRQKKYTPCISCGQLSGPKHDYCQRCANSGDRNHNWTGGRHLCGAGYIRIKANSPHPRGDRWNRIYEHILVMEDKLGRYLIKHENVHHINGIKTDNRPGNLELWSTHQPSGQRVEDLVSWAIEILKQYATISD